MASNDSPKKNAILIGIAAVLLVGALVFGFREYLFTPKQPVGATESATNSDEVVNRITGGQAPMAEPDPPGPKPEPGSGRRARKPE